MLIRVSLVVVLGLLGACKSAGGKLPVDSPLTPYKAPDIDELTGIEPADEPDQPDADEKPEPAPPPAKK